MSLCKPTARNRTAVGLIVVAISVFASYTALDLTGRFGQGPGGVASEDGRFGPDGSVYVRASLPGPPGADRAGLMRVPLSDDGVPGAGRVVLFAASGPDGGVVYRYDDTNPDGRSARVLVDRADLECMAAWAQTNIILRRSASRETSAVELTLKTRHSCS